MNKEFKKEQIHFDQNNYEQSLRSYESHLPFFQTILDKYNALGIENTLTTEEFKEMVKNPKDILVNKILNGEEISVAGLKIKGANLFEMLEKPQAYEEYVNWLKRVVDAGEQTKKYYLMSVNNYSLNDTRDTVVINPEILDRIKEAATTYISTEKQKKAYMICQDIAKKLNDLKELNGGFMYDNFLYNEVLSNIGDMNPRNDYGVKHTVVRNF